MQSRAPKCNAFWTALIPSHGHSLWDGPHSWQGFPLPIFRLAIERKQLHVEEARRKGPPRKKKKHFKASQVQQMSFKWKQIDRRTTKPQRRWQSRSKMEGARAARIKRGDCCKVQEMSPNCRLAVGRLKKMAQTMEDNGHRRSCPGDNSL